MSDEELETLVEMGEAEGTLHEAEGEMIQEIIKLGDKTAKDCMTPRVDTFAVPDDLPNDEAIALFKQRRHRRVPVYAETPDQIVGLVDVKNFCSIRGNITPKRSSLRHSSRRRWLRSICCEAFFRTHKASRSWWTSSAEPKALLPSGDIIEEIFSDAAPLGDAGLYIRPLEDGRFIVSGSARLDDLTEHLGFEINADGIDTIGGYVFNRLGYLPNVGARLEIPRLVITTRRVSRKRIEELLLENRCRRGSRSASVEQV